MSEARKRKHTDLITPPPELVVHADNHLKHIDTPERLAIIGAQNIF